jgi:hypothetical protein
LGLDPRRRENSTASDDITVRILQRDEVNDEFLDVAAGVLNRAFGRWPAHSLAVPVQEHLRWKMSSPVADFGAAIVAEVDGRLAGYRTILPRRVLVHGEPKLFLHFVDAAVDPSMQGRGIYRATQDFIQSKLHPLFDLSLEDGQNPIVVRTRTRLGAVRDYGNPIRPYLLPLDAPRLLRTTAAAPARVPRQLAAVLIAAASVTRRISSVGRGERAGHRSIRTIDHFDERFDAFCAEAARPFALIPERTSAFLNWRYLDPRAGDYVARVAERGDEVLGYSVVRVAADTTEVLDLLARPGLAWVARELIDDAVRLGRAANAAAVGCWMAARHPYRRALRGAGFVTLGRTTSLKYRAVSMSDEELAFLRERDVRLHITHGDTDFI